MSRLQLLHSNTMRSSASDYFIICDNQQSFSHEQPSRLVFCGFPPSFAPNRKRLSSKATIAVAFSAKLLAPAGRSEPAIFSADDWLFS